MKFFKKFRIFKKHESIDLRGDLKQNQIGTPDNTATISTDITNNKNMPITQRKPKKIFDVQIIEYDDNGKQILSQANGIYADSREQLIQIHRDCGQEIRILSERDVNTDTGEISNNNVVNSAVAATQVIKEQLQPIQQNNITTTTTNNILQPSPAISTSPVSQSEPSFFTIGGVNCKLVDGVIYQQQWVKLSTTEMQNYRLISTATNKIVNLANKHIEVLKWVKIDETSV